MEAVTVWNLEDIHMIAPDGKRVGTITKVNVTRDCSYTGANFLGDISKNLSTMNSDTIVMTVEVVITHEEWNSRFSTVLCNEPESRFTTLTRKTLPK
jgi:hypothetical protein